MTVSVAGEIDLASAPDMLATLLRAAKLGTSGIMVEASGITFFSAAGVNALIHARNLEREQGRDLLVRAPSTLVYRLLDICGLANLVEPTGDGGPCLDPSQMIGRRRSLGRPAGVGEPPALNRVSDPDGDRTGRKGRAWSAGPQETP